MPPKPFNPPRPSSKPGPSKPRGRPKSSASTSTSKSTAKGKAPKAQKPRVSKPPTPQEEDEEMEEAEEIDDPFASQPTDKPQSKPEASTSKPSAPNHNGDPLSSDSEIEMLNSPPAHSKAAHAQEEEEDEDEDLDERTKIPDDLLSKIMHELFTEPNSRISKEANRAVGKYLDTFVREAVARVSAPIYRATFCTANRGPAFAVAVASAGLEDVDVDADPDADADADDSPLLPEDVPEAAEGPSLVAVPDESEPEPELDPDEPEEDVEPELEGPEVGEVDAMPLSRCFDLHGHAEDWDHTSAIRSSYIHESTEDACIVGALANGYAWCVEGGLGDGVVPACELELDDIAHVCFDVVRGVREAIAGRGADAHDVGYLCGGVGGSWKGERALVVRSE
ncbi:hypothetical protein DSL72_008349 [Monilinia vaccinii-corymbosi]|uniref:Uncharacterized protein n=1 Tax=Monilinia vaccinii-corymbosi TaxID=61207 RepID=A0A8A3PKG8_9HELO|nr:hypothetical protein DSL72_008349 [Monilinia vaccinii-corymbosi]